MLLCLPVANLTTSTNLMPPAPRSVVRAVRLMYAGAALTALTALVVILVAPSVGELQVIGRPPILESHTRQMVRTTFSGVIDSAAWLWMSWKNKSGRAWARVLSTVFFALFCISLPLSLRLAEATVIKPFQVAIWLVGLAVTIHLWRSESGSFYRRQVHQARNEVSNSA